MTITNRDGVAGVLALFERRNGATIRFDAFQNYMMHLYASSESAVESPLGIAIGKTYAGFESLLAILERSEWQKQQAKNGTLNHTSWMTFACLDIEHFYISVRSLFDHIAEICSVSAKKANQSPSSFNDLLKLCEQNEHRVDNLLGVDLRLLICSCDWFRDLRDTRDGIVHSGGSTLALPDFETIAFKVFAGTRSAKLPAELMSNERVGDFELFMAWVIGNLLLLLNQLAVILKGRLGDHATATVMTDRASYPILCSYLDRLYLRYPAQSGPPRTGV